MGEIIEHIRKYRVRREPDEKVRLAGEVIQLIAAKIYLFILPRVPEAAEDLRQTVCIAIVQSLEGFNGDSEPEFWGWCYQIARHAISKHFRGEGSKRFIPLDPEEITRLLDASASDEPYATDEQQDLKEALGLLRKSDPECFDLLWSFFVVGFNYKEIATESGLDYDNVRMKIRRCVDYAQTLLD